MSHHQRAPGFGRPSTSPTDSNENTTHLNNLNVVSSGFWSKSSPANPISSNMNQFTFPIGNQFNESNSITSSCNNTVNSGDGGGGNRFELSPPTLFRDENFWKQSPSINSINPIPINPRSMGLDGSTNNQPTSTYTTYTPLINNNLTNNNNRVKSSSSQTSHRIYGNYQASPQELLLAQFLGLYLDNQQQSISNDNLNSISSSSSHGSYNLIDPIGTPSNQTNAISSLRKLKARTTEDNLSSLSNPNNSISLDQYHQSAMPLVSPSSHNGGGGGGGGRRKNRRGSCIECVFCKNNGQPSSFYQGHVLKDVLGRVTCPILFAYDCPICHNGGGPKAHTVRYCPENKPSNRLRNALLKAQIG